MLFDEPAGSDIFELSDALEAIQELERNTSEAVIARRASERIDIQLRIRIRPGNASERHMYEIHGMTADISNGGSMILVPRPIMVGDLFWISFCDERIRLNALLARCLRCRMIEEGSFETGFRFLQDIDLRQSLSVEGE